tara:strand:- start:30569 stop:30991 length:423 start_codon:yes stop_codon:yes gene_type:complete
MNNNRSIRALNLETGQLLDGTIAFIQRKRKNGFSNWLALNQESLRRLSSPVHNITGIDFRILMALLSELEHENIIQTTQKEIAAQCGIRTQHVSRSIQKLLTAGIIEKSSRSLKLCPDFGWRGSAKNHNLELSMRARNLT